MIKLGLSIASAAVLLTAGPAAALPGGDVIVATDATTGTAVAMSAQTGSGKTDVPCGGDLTHSGPRFFLKVTQHFDSPTWSELSAHDENCTWAATLLADPGLHVDFARWSPDGSRIAFDGARTDLVTGLLIERGIYVADVGRDEAGRPSAISGMRFAVDTPDSEAVDLSWVRDGVRVVYSAPVPTGSGGSQYDLFVASVDGGAALNVTNSAASEFAPEASPVADLIAFTKPVVQKGLSGSNVYTMALTGGSQKQLTTTKNTKTAVNLHPTWSPSGEHMAFSGRGSSAGASPDIITVNAAGSGKAVNLTAESNHIYYQPNWRR